MTHISNKTIILSKTSVRSGKGNGFGDECCGDDMEDYEDQFFEDQPYEEEYYEEYYEEFYEQEQKIEEHIERATEIEMIDEEEEEVVVPKTKAPKPVVEEMDIEYKKYLALLNTRAVESKKLEDKMLHEVYCWADSMQVPVTDFGVTLEQQYENVQFEQKAALKKAADKFEEEEKIRVAKEAQEQVDAMIEFEENKANEVAKNKKNGWRKGKIAERVAARNKVKLDQLRARQLFASQKLKYEIALKQAVKKGKSQEMKDLNAKLETLESTFKPAGKRLGRKMGNIVKQVDQNLVCDNNKIVTSHQISVEEDFDSDCEEEEEEPMKLVLPEFSNFIVEEDKKHIQTVAMNDKITKSLKKTAIKNKLREEDDKTWTKVQLKKVSAECNQVGRAEKAKKIVEKKEETVETKKCTRMCSSVAAKIECPHGHRCRFAHTVSELVKQFCAFDCDCILVRINKQGDLINVPSKKTGKVCSFWHTDETEEMYAKRFGYISQVPQQVVPQVFVEEVVSVPQVQKPVDNRVDFWPEIKQVRENPWKVTVVNTKTVKQIQESQASVILEKPVVVDQVENNNGYKHYYNANFKTGQTVEYVPSKGPITIRIPKAHAEFAYFKAIEQGYFDIQLIITD
jgi:hypothetical protein